VAFAAKNFELDSIEERVKKSLDIAGLSFDEFKDRSPFYPFRWRKEKSGVGFSNLLLVWMGHPRKPFGIGCGVTAIAKERLSLLPIRWKKLWLLKGYWCSPLLMFRVRCSRM